MARSAHTTLRTLRELGRRKFPSVKEKLAAFETVFAALERKRRIKRSVRPGPTWEEPPLEGATVGAIPIEVLDECEVVHHGASPQDIRAILALLPRAATEGIARIQLSQGKEYMDARTDDEGGSRDPFTRRRSTEVFPGVFGGEVLGTYSGRLDLVCIYAYVYDPTRLPLPRPSCEFYLRLHALKTLLHEVAHHDDQVAHIARGRWRSDWKPAGEWYAEKMEHEWTRKLVLPYLQRTYPKEALALRKWVARRGGLMVGLEFFAGDARRTERNGSERVVFSTAGVFESWVGQLADCTSLGESRLALATELHNANAHADCLKVLDVILAREPRSIQALTCKADTLVHLNRLDEALAIAEQVLRSAPANADAWEILGDVFEGRKDWAKLLRHCEAWQRSAGLTHAAARRLCLQRAIAGCALGDGAGMAASVAAHLASTACRTKEAARKRRRLVLRHVYRRAGKSIPREYTPHRR